MKSEKKWHLPASFGVACTAGILLSGCASPGPPRPPSLHLPEQVTNLTAERIGDEVRLQWTTPATTTDGQAIKAGVTAVLCREDAPAPGKKKPACPALQRFSVTPGVGKATDHLQGAQTADSPVLLAYRVELLNAKGRSAGPSAPVYAASGAAPKPVSALTVTDRPDGARIQWQHGDAPVQVRRTLVADANGAAPAATAPGKSANAPNEILLGTGDTDSGGMIDATAQRRTTYRYKAQRIRTVTLASHKLELRSVDSPAVAHRVRDTFPPPTPEGLAVVPGFGGSPSVDLSWEPVSASDLAGYLVYRKSGDTWTRLTPQPVEATSYRDTTATPGASFLYRVTAIDQTGNESGPSAESKDNPGP